MFDKPHWRTVLSTKDKAEAEAMEQAMIQDGVKAKIEDHAEGEEALVHQQVGANAGQQRASGHAGHAALSDSARRRQRAWWQ